MWGSEMGKHTPGPWDVYISRDAQDHDVCGDICNSRGSIAHVINYDRSSAFSNRARDEANARLIAAAPSLFDAGTKALHEIDAILQAFEGQPEHFHLTAAFDALEAALNQADRNQ